MSEAVKKYDVIVLGGGAAGLMCALTASQRGKRVLVIEISNKLGKKILMSGGGHCNFTNLDIQANNFLSDNPHFVKSALKQYTQWDFISLVNKHNIAYQEKKHGQLFCDATKKYSSKHILKMLVDECERGATQFILETAVTDVDVDDDIKHVHTNQGVFCAPNLVVATGGLSIPTLGGASGFGYKLAQKLDLKLNSRRASLVPMTLTGDVHDLAKALAGVSVNVEVTIDDVSFHEDMLFTHRGISGPSILQLSNYWLSGQEVKINLLPNVDVVEQLRSLKIQSPKTRLRTYFLQYLPKSLVLELQAMYWKIKAEDEINSFKNKELESISEKVCQWVIKPSGTEGYRTAEVTLGGVDTNQISSKTMEVKNQKGLYFIGEVLDVTGHLGGYNFQWAWSSAYVAGNHVC